MPCRVIRVWSPLVGAVAGLGVILAGCDESPVPAARPPIETRQTIGKTTQTVLELSRALADGGVPVEGGGSAAGLDALADAARASAGTIGALAVEQKLRLYEAENGHKPATYDEFVSRIIAAGTPEAISLPMLPYYQEWAYDPAARKLVVVEFPARRQQRREETTGSGSNR